MALPAPLFEAVPNFSEGKDRAKISRITGAVRAVPGVRVLNVHSDPDHNRSVLTFAGEEDAVLEAAVTLAGACAAEIDLASQTGQPAGRGRGWGDSASPSTSTRPPRPPHTGATWPTSGAAATRVSPLAWKILSGNLTTGHRSWIPTGEPSRSVPDPSSWPSTPTSTPPT